MKVGGLSTPNNFDVSASFKKSYRLFSRHLRQRLKKNTMCPMLTLEQIQSKVEQALPGAQVVVGDMTGGGDHIRVEVIWKGFMGKSLIEQHRFVKKALQADLDSGAIHALSVKTSLP